MRSLQLALIEIGVAVASARTQGAAGQQGLAQPDPADHHASKQVQIGRGIGHAEVGIGRHLRLQAGGDLLEYAQGIGQQCRERRTVWVAVGGEQGGKHFGSEQSIAVTSARPQFST
ncbi:hypothetical protein D3C76_707410 [compost metagenome]